MLRSLHELRGYNLAATDGRFGTVKDFYFDDIHWVVRYLTVDTGKWLPGREVLISPLAVTNTDWTERIITVSLSCEQIENSPSIEADQPVSRQKEQKLVDYYNWAPYWAPGGLTGRAPVAPVPQPGAIETEEEIGDPNLRSVQEVRGYHIRAQDGEMGHIDDFIVEMPHLVIRYIVVDTRNWLPGRKVLVAPDWIGAVDWWGREVDVDMPRDQIKNSPEFSPDAPVNREYEARLYDYYGRPVYWK